MNNCVSRRKLLGNAGVVAALQGWSALFRGNLHNLHSFANAPSDSPAISEWIVDMHVYFDEKNPNFISDLLRLSDRLNLTACVLTSFANRKVVLDAVKQHP